MALVSCKECNSQISSKAKTCTSCGIKVRQGRFRRILIAISLVLGCMYALAMNSLSGSPVNQANLKNSNAKDSIVRNIVICERKIKEKLRDPDIAQFDGDIIDQDKIVPGKKELIIPLKLRAKNGFGGYNTLNTAKCVMKWSEQEQKYNLTEIN